MGEGLEKGLTSILASCPGLKELTLSANPGITPKGWSRLAIAVAHSSQVRVLNLDYNPLGEVQEGPLRFSPPLILI